MDDINPESLRFWSVQDIGPSGYNVKKTDTGFVVEGYYPSIDEWRPIEKTRSNTARRCRIRFKRWLAETKGMASPEEVLEK